MRSGIKGLNRGGIRDHNPWDRDQQCLHGIRDHSVLHTCNNKSPIKITKRTFQALIWDFHNLVLFSDFLFKNIRSCQIRDNLFDLFRIPSFN